MSTHSLSDGWVVANIERRTALKKSSNGPAFAALVAATKAKIDNQTTIVRAGRFTMMRDTRQTAEPWASMSLPGVPPLTPMLRIRRAN